MIRACSKLGIRLRYAKPYSPESTGKIERLNRVIDSFLAEVKLSIPKTLEDLNSMFSVWLEECYQYKLHSALDEGKSSPYKAYQEDRRPLRFETPEVISAAFLHCESRKVDKAGCINFMSKKFEVGLAFIGCRVDVIYDPVCIDILTIEHEGHAPFTVKELVIGPYAGKRPTMPESITAVKASSSRVLDGATKKNQVRKREIIQAVSYASMNKGETANV